MKQFGWENFDDRKMFILIIVEIFSQMMDITIEFFDFLLIKSMQQLFLEEKNIL